MFQKIFDHIKGFTYAIIGLVLIYAGIANYLHPKQDALIPYDAKLLHGFEIIIGLLFASLIIDLGIILFKNKS